MYISKHKRRTFSTPTEGKFIYLMFGKIGIRSPKTFHNPHFRFEISQNSVKSTVGSENDQFRGRIGSRW